jgi:hypothetical protein
MSVFVGRTKMQVVTALPTVDNTTRIMACEQGGDTYIEFCVDKNSDYMPKVGDMLMVTISRCLESPPVLSAPNAKD